ncbi:MAG: HAMP domain-containing histidine kinase, partial [Acidobacteria bacterium]|nr:HAMP domain-containing histidine kinase [Acidobacteriota bacterium]
VLPDAPALLLWGGPSSDGERPRDLVVLLLDAGFLEDDLLPQLVARHFGDVGGDYELTVRRVSDDHEVFHSGATVAAVTVEDGMSWPLFQVRPFPDLFALDPGVERGPGVAAEWLRRQRGRPVAPRHWHPGSGHRGDAGWRLEVRFRAGSLEAAVARSRRRNLAVSLGVLGLLAASVLLTVLAARRAQRLARQQMELVAGVTHELYTPLAALRSAGQNLADGVVREPEQVRRYGSLVEEEGRRLSTMVQRMLDLAGLGSGQRVLAREPVAVAPLVEAAVAECRQLLAARGVEAEIDLAPDLPPLLGDREALRRALVNLIENAAQHAAGGGWVGVRGRLGRGGRRVQLVVEDRGPGLDGEDLPHLFDPFYRGRRVSSQIHGSGLGLSLVQRIVRAHGGRVTAGPGHGGTGAAFTLELPVAETSS